VYDVRAGKSLGAVAKLSVTVQPYDPVIFAVMAAPIPQLEVSTPERTARGGWLDIGVHFAHPSLAAVQAIHVDLVDPSGKIAAAYSGNWLADHGEASRRIPLAISDPTGRWEVRVRDVISGQHKQAVVEVY
jgi:hypothetical protein